MAPTSLVGQVTQTSPYGRKVEMQGYPVKVAEMLSTLEGSAFIKRCSVDSIKNINDTRASIKKAFQCQIDKKGFSLIEVLSTCPTNWGLSPVEALEWLRGNMMPHYPLGTYKDITGGDKK